MTVCFAAASDDEKSQEEGGLFAPRFNGDGLLSAVVTDETGSGVLMVAYMNAHALGLTLQTGIAHFWSRSRNSLWKKGESSGNLLHVKEIRTDCDQDALWLKVQVGGHGTACHTGTRSCFYRQVNLDGGLARLTAVPTLA
jgi:phosphoribosyl-AMP cyclohydrolase